MAAKNSVCPTGAKKLSNGACQDTTTKKFVKSLARNASSNASRNASANKPVKAKSKKKAKKSASVSVRCGCTQAPARAKLSTSKRKSKKGGK